MVLLLEGRILLTLFIEKITFSSARSEFFNAKMTIGMVSRFIVIMLR